MNKQIHALKIKLASMKDVKKVAVLKLKNQQIEKPHMTIKESIHEAARYFASVGEFSPSHCDVRCFINELTQNNPRILREGYNQDVAFARVCNLLKSAAIFQH